VADLLRHRPGLRIQLEIGKSDDLERALHAVFVPDLFPRRMVQDQTVQDQTARDPTAGEHNARPPSGNCQL
jgi:hypothetical protein